MGGLRYGLWRDFDVPETITACGLWEGQSQEILGFKLLEGQKFKALGH